MKKSFADIMASMEESFRKKIDGKIPSWKGLDVPSVLAFEQCSSEKTASYKLRFVPEGAVVADLTGGLGVDSSAFARLASELYYFEQNSRLCEAASENFAALGLGNVHCSNLTVDASTPLPQCDFIYMDPARRSGTGKKVFLLEDCTPNVLEMMPLLWRSTSRLLLKLSPMADLTLVVRRLGQALEEAACGASVTEVHVVESGGEVKELLVLMEKAADGKAEAASAGKEPLIVATDLASSFGFTQSEEASAPAVIEMPRPGQYIFVPAGALMKAGAYNSIGLPRLSQHSHLYLCDDLHQGREGIFGRYYRIEELHPFGSASIRALAGRYAAADVSCHDLPLRSEELSKRLRCKSGGDVHIFASPSADGNIMLICSKL